MPRTALVQPRKQPRQGRSKATVQAILDATAHILVQEGYEGLNTNRVAQLAGASIGSLYQYFPNKTALITALRERHADQMRELLMATAVHAAMQPLDQAVPTLVHAVMQAHHVDPSLHQVLEQEVPRHTQQAETTPWELELRMLLKGLLAPYQAQLQVQDLDVACLVLVRTVDALVHAALTDDPLGVQPEAIEKEISTVVLRYLTGSLTGTQ